MSVSNLDSYRSKLTRLSITTYAEVRGSWPKTNRKDDNFENLDMAQILERYANELKHEKDLGVLHQIEWHRVVLDEAHYIKNPNTRTSESCRGLKSKYRWAMTGTPIHNTFVEAFSYLDFLRDPNTTTRAAFIKRYKPNLEALSTTLRGSMIRRTYKTTLFNRRIVWIRSRAQIQHGDHGLDHECNRQCSGR